MTKYSWEQQRLDIQARIDDYFGTHITITPRGMAGLQAEEAADSKEFEEDEREGTIDRAHVAFEEEVAESLIRSSPAIAMILFHVGVELSRLPRAPKTRVPAPLASSTPDWIFKGVDAKTLTPRARRVVRVRKLDELDLFLSLLEASVQGTEPNSLGGNLLKAAGIDEPSHVRAYLTKEDLAWQRCDDYLLRLCKEAKKIVKADPSHSLLQFALYLDDKRRIHVRPFGVGTLSRVSGAHPLDEEQKYIYRGGILQPITSVLPGLSEDILGQLEEMMESRHATEQDFQDFFRFHPELLTGLNFKKAHPQPILYQDEGSLLIPDFFLEKLSVGWDVILDLKKPYDEMVTRRKNRTYFKQHVQNAIAQLEFYKEWFDSPSNRRLFQEHYGVSTFRPRMVIVIGRKHHFRDDVERVRLLDTLPQHLDIWTYDDLLQRAKRYLQLVTRFTGMQQP